MVTAFAALVFAASSLACAHRLRTATRARDYLVFTPFIVAAWTALLTTRHPTAGSMVLNFLLLDMTIMLLACFGIFRMLGAFDPDPWAAGDDGPGGDDSDPRGPSAPEGPQLHTAPRTPRPAVSARRPRGTARTRLPRTAPGQE
ncbi:MAG: hypothetical protein JWN72_2832 [Thermoleophilia bacterium]|nr:hypothetical protein [Thermoleophilia bacterium]